MFSPFMRQQRGSISIMVLLIVLFLGIILMGLLSRVNLGARSVSQTANLIEAQYAAEAGAKRAIVGLQQGRTDWGWLGEDPVTFSDNADKTYTVTIAPNPVSASNVIVDGEPPSPGNYTVTSTGRITGTQDSFTKTIIAEVSITSLAPNDVPKDYGVYAGGKDENDRSIYTASGSIPINNTKIAGSGKIIGIGGSCTKDENTSINLPSYSYSEYIASSPTPRPLFPAASPLKDNTNLLAGGNYYYNGTLTIKYPQNNNITLKVNTGNTVVVFVKNDLIFDTNLNVDISGTGKLLFIVGGTVQTIGNNSNFKNTLIYSHGNINLGQNSNFNNGCCLISKGAIKFGQSNNVSNLDLNLIDTLNEVMGDFSLPSQEDPSTDPSSSTVKWRLS